MLNLSEVAAHHKERTIAPDAAPCPRCGTWCPRNEIRRRGFWIPDLRQPTIMDLGVGCYICLNCPKGSQWFTVAPADYRTPGQYSLPGKEVVVDLVKTFKLSIEGAAMVGRKVLHLGMLHPTTVLEWVREAGDAVDHKARLEALVSNFSGQMDIDEVYDGEWCQLKATDPLNNIELNWYLIEGSATKDDIREFLMRLKTAGFEPKLVTTDGSDLYPDVIAEVWPEAEHQRCVFHFIKQVNEVLGKAFWVAYKTMPEPPKRKRGRPKKRGRPRKDKLKRENRKKVRNARYLLLKRERNGPDQPDLLDEKARASLDEAIALCPPLGVLRRLIVRIHDLFGSTTTTQELAQERREAILNDPEFAATSGIEKILAWLADDDLFARLTRYLDFENAEKTSNHVERENREFRKRQKSHYRIRSLASMCALLDLLSARRPIPEQPRKLRRRTQVPPAGQAGKEVSLAA